MTFDHYMKFVQAGVRMDTHGDTTRERLMLAGMGLAGEAGEVCDEAKKIAFHDKATARDLMVKELGDVLWYYALMLHTTKITLDEVMEANVFKLCARYGDRHGTPENVIAERAV